MQNNTFSTLFVGQNLIKLPSVDSTNNYLKNLVSNSEPLAEGTVIMAGHQFEGRGQQESKWLVEPDKNITMSVLLKPHFLKIESQFLLNMSVSIAINKAISTFLLNGVTVKWPNDIYHKNKKIGGVLIENTLAGNQIKTSVIGVGINVNQTEFSEELAGKASSMAKVLNAELSLDAVMAHIFSAMEAMYLQLKVGNYNFLRNTYVDKLYRYNVITKFRANGDIFDGIIRGVEDSGLLLVETEEKIEKYNFKEIEFLNTQNQ